MIQGDLLTFPFLDLIQSLTLNGSTGQLVLAHNVERVEIHFQSGEIIGAVNGQRGFSANGEQVRAVLETALSWRRGQFTFINGPLPERGQATNGHRSIESLLPAVKPEATALTPARSLRLQVASRILREDFTMPAMPHIAAQVLELTGNENFSLRDLGNLIVTDQAIVARLLRYANSPMHGFSREIDSVALAVLRLGTGEVVNIVLAATLQAQQIRGDLFAAEKRHLWLHSSATAFCARTLAIKARLRSDLGFLCGLFMNFGQNVLYSILQQVLGHTEAKAIPREIIEGIVRDYQARVGQTVGGRWRLPPAVIEAMNYRHSLDANSANRSYVAAAAIAHALTKFALRVPRPELEAALVNFPPARLAALPAARILGLTADEAAVVLANLPQRLDQALEFVRD